MSVDEVVEDYVMVGRGLNVEGCLFLCGVGWGLDVIREPRLGGE